MNNNKTDLNVIIDDGEKIMMDEENEIIKIIKGVCLKDSYYKPLFNEVKVSSDEIKNLKKNYHYSSALFNPVKRGIILIDISGYSKFDNLYQVACLNILNRAIKNSIDRIAHSGVNVKQVFKKIISTGDGYYIIFHEDLNETFFRTAIYFISEMYTVQKNIFKNLGRKISNNIVNIRISCTLNDVDFFKDVMGGSNCYGIGLNDAARILSCVQNKLKKNKIHNSSIFFDHTLFEQAKSFLSKLKQVLPSVKAELRFFKPIEDKHGKKHRIGWVKNLPKQCSFDLFSIDKII